MAAARIIKKYPNRRLYDTEESRYITLADIRNLVRNKIDFTVIDKKSGDDITRSILLQVISEQEQHGDEAVMSRDFLSQIIRSYDKVMPGFMAKYLEQSTKLFMTQQQNLRGQVKKVVGVDPVAAVADIAQTNYNRWRSLQDEVFRRFSGSSRDDRDDDDDEPGNEPRNEPRNERRNRKKVG